MAKTGGKCCSIFMCVLISVLKKVHSSKNDEKYQKRTEANSNGGKNVKMLCKKGRYNIQVTIIIDPKLFFTLCLMLTFFSDSQFKKSFF